VTDQVQEWAVEELCSFGGPTNWPECPLHSDFHPLSAVVRGGPRSVELPKDRARGARDRTAAHCREIGQGLRAPGAACADDWSGSSRSIWSKSLSALSALEEVERGRRDTVVLSDR
jgi:hypothetical protein